MGSFLFLASGSFILCAQYDLDLLKCFFSKPRNWFSHVNNIVRNIISRCDYYFVLISVCSSLTAIGNEMFHQQ